MNNSTAIVDTYFKQQNKEHRQQLKLNCLNLAIDAAKGYSANTEAIVTSAKAFYAFVRT